MRPGVGPEVGRETLVGRRRRRARLRALGPVAHLAKEVPVSLRPGEQPRLAPALVGHGLAQLPSRGDKVGTRALRALIDEEYDDVPMMGDAHIEGTNLLFGALDQLANDNFL